MLNAIEIMPLKNRATAMWLPLLLAGMTMAGAASAQAATVDGRLERTTYRVVNLGRGDSIGAVIINAGGQVAFTMGNGLDGPVHAFFYDGKTIRDIGTLGGDFARVTGLNDAGQVTGVSWNASNTVRAFAWSKQRGMIDLGALPGATSSWEPAINSNGEITGESHGDPLPYPRAFRWTLSSGMEDLGGLASGADTISYGRAINDAGLIAGTSLTPDYAHHAFAWTRATGMVDIDTLGNRYSDVIGVGAEGQVGGNFFAPDANTRGFIWTRGEGMRDIGTAGAEGTWIVGMTPSARLSGVTVSPQQAMTWTRDSGLVLLGTLGGGSSSAVGANNLGQVVGGAATAANDWRAFVWSAATGMIDLNTRLRHAPAKLTLYSAQAVSDKGAIVAVSNAGLVLLTPDRVCGCAHTVGPISAAELVQVGAPFDASVSFAGEDNAAKHNVIWSWGDGNGENAGTTTASNGSGRATGSHRFMAPGMYTVSARVTDLAGNSVAVSRNIIAYDKSSRFAGGAGSFVSPHVPNKNAPFQAGLATFSFIATGQLHFQVGALNFRSTALRATGRQGQFAGEGTINGTGRYQFSMQTRPGDGKGREAGSFGLKIWRTDPQSGAALVAYDSQGPQDASSERKLADGTVLVQ